MKPWEEYQQKKKPWEEYAEGEEVVTPADGELEGLGGAALGTMGAVAKGLDVPRALTGAPLLGLALEAMTGKDVFKSKDLLNAVNPTNLSTFPSASEMFERAGVPEGAKLSDILPYGKAGESPWYQPEEGGLLDFTVRGAGGFGTDVALDPLTYLSFGSSALAKKAAKESASRAAFKSAAKPGVIGKAAQKAGESFDEIVDFLKMPQAAKVAQGSRIGRAFEGAATAPSTAIKDLGKKVYSSVITPLEHEGQKFGKKEIGETLYNAGIKSPLGLRDKAENAKNILMRERDQLLEEAGQQGAKVSMKRATNEARNKIQELRAVQDSDAWALADEMEAKLDEYIAIETGSPDVVEKVVENVGILDAQGKPVTREVDKLVKKGVAPKPYTPAAATKVKSFIYENLPTSTYQKNYNTKVGSRIQSAISKGFKEETEDSVARALGSKAGADLAELNAEAGKLLATRKAQTRVSNAADRLSDSAASITGTDAFLGGAGTAVSGEVTGGLKAAALKKVLDAIRLGTMPIGYGMRTMGEGTLSGPMIDVITRQNYKDLTSRGSEDERKKRGEK